MLDHFGFMVKNKDKSCNFYTAALAPLGIEAVTKFANWQGFGRHGKAEFWIGSQQGVSLQGSLHLAFNASSRVEVQQFYSAALAAGGQDRGAPDLRPHYHSHYYSAFVADPEGHIIEAVCHSPA